MLRRLRRCCAISVFGVAVLAGGVAHADARAELEKARASFLARNWADAEERLRVLLDPKTGLKDRSLISQARMYLGASLFAQGKKDDAKEIFEKLVLDDPTFEPDPLSFPSDAINTFIDVRSSLLEQIRTATQTAARLAAERKAREEAEREAQRVWFEKVKAQAAEEKITVRHNRVVASLPFGAGQFQNGQPVLGWIFLGTEVAAIAGTVVVWGMYRYARGREGEELQNKEDQLSPQWHQRAEDLRFVNLGFAGAFGVVAAIGIVQAHLAYVPESPEKKKRDLPAMGKNNNNNNNSVEIDSGNGGNTNTSNASKRSHSHSVLSSITPTVSPLPGRDAAPGGVFLGIHGALF